MALPQVQDNDSGSVARGKINTAIGQVDANATSIASKADTTYVDSQNLLDEKVDKKSTDVDTDKTSDTKYPSVKSVYDWAIGLFQDILISGTNIKTVNGTTLLGAGDLSVGSSFGKFGITDSDGEYTYYDTLTLAMTAASAGDTIEQFADVTESGDVTVEFKSVNFNGNDHTYTYEGTIIPFDDADTAPNITISNWNLIVTTYTGYAFDSRGRTFGSNFYIESALGAGYYASSSAEVLGVNVKSFRTPFALDSAAIAINCNTEITSTGFTYTGFFNNGIAINCHSRTSSAGYAFTNTGVARWCSGVSSAGASEAFNNSGKAYFCYASGLSRSFSGGGELHVCDSYSTAGRSVVGASLVAGGSHVSELSNAADGCDIIRGGQFRTISGSHVIDRSYDIKGATIDNEYNNANGHGVQYDADGTITNCAITVANTSANCLNAGVARTVKLGNNSFEGSTVDIHANITPSGALDAYGNISI